MGSGPVLLSGLVGVVFGLMCAFSFCLWLGFEFDFGLLKVQFFDMFGLIRAFWACFRFDLTQPST